MKRGTVPMKAISMRRCVNVTIMALLLGGMFHPAIARDDGRETVIQDRDASPVTDSAVAEELPIAADAQSLEIPGDCFGLSGDRLETPFYRSAPGFSIDSADRCFRECTDFCPEDCEDDCELGLLACGSCLVACDLGCAIGCGAV